MASVRRPAMPSESYNIGQDASLPSSSASHSAMPPPPVPTSSLVPKETALPLLITFSFLGIDGQQLVDPNDPGTESLELNHDPSEDPRFDPDILAAFNQARKAFTMYNVEPVLVRSYAEFDMVVDTLWECVYRAVDGLGQRYKDIIQLVSVWA